MKNLLAMMAALLLFALIPAGLFVGAHLNNGFVFFGTMFAGPIVVAEGIIGAFTFIDRMFE